MVVRSTFYWLTVHYNIYFIKYQQKADDEGEKILFSLQQFEKISTVMYEPLQYIHPDYKTVATLDDKLIWQQFANYQLIKEHN